jgi:tetratricopeptide (TPR) repeat protein
MTLRSQLLALESSGLIAVAATQPELEYLFRHALIHDAAYASLVKFDRIELHRVVGETLERLYPDRSASQELAPRLAEHFYEAGDDERALKYFTLAGDAAARVYANAEALLHYTRALDIVKRLALQDRPPLPGEMSLQRLYLRRGRTLELSGQYAEAVTNYVEMESLARECGDRVLELAALIARATVHAAPTSVHNAPQSQALCEQALALARELDDRAAEAKILWTLTLSHRVLGQLEKSHQYAEQSLALARALGLREQIAYTLTDSYASYMFSGQAERARAALEEATALWRELGNQHMLTDTLTGLAGMSTLAGQFEQGLALTDEAHRISLQTANAWGRAYSQYAACRIHLVLGDVARAIASMEECIHYADAAGFGNGIVEARCQLADLYGSLGESERGLQLAREADAITSNRFPAWRAISMGTLAHLYLYAGNFAAAEEAVQAAFAHLGSDVARAMSAAFVVPAAIELALAQEDGARALALAEQSLGVLRGIGARTFLVTGLFYKGRALQLLGQLEEAAAVLNETRAEAETLGMRRYLWRILAALAEIEAGRGHAANAQVLRKQARETITYIADHCPPDPSAGSGQSLRASFLHLPDVQAVLDSIQDQ